MSRALPASLFARACTGLLTDLLRTGKRTSLFRLFSQGTVVFPFVLRKDPDALSRRPFDRIAGMAGRDLIFFVRPCERALPLNAGGRALLRAGTAMKAFGEAAPGHGPGIVAADPGRPGSGDVSLWP